MSMELRPMVPRKAEHIPDFEQGRAMGWDLVLDGAVVGYVAIHHIDQRNLCAHVAYEIDVEQRQKGLMTDALRFAIDHAFGQLALHRLEAHVDPENTASLRLAERVGFKREALLRQNVIEDGIFHDTVLLALLSDEWGNRT